MSDQETRLREVLVAAVNGNPISADDAWALIHAWDARAWYARAVVEERDAAVKALADLLALAEDQDLDASIGDEKFKVIVQARAVLASLAAADTEPGGGQ